MLVFTFRFAQQAVVIFKSNVSGISTQQFMYSANLEYNLYHTCYAWHIHYDWKIQCLEVENVYMQIWMANLPFHNFDFHPCHLVAQVVFRVEVTLLATLSQILVEVRQFLSASSMSANSVLYDSGIEGSRQYDLYKPLRGVFLSQPSPFYAQQTQLLTSSLLGLRPEVSWLLVAFPLLQDVKTLFWPFPPYLRQGTYRTVPAVPDLLASEW